VIWRFLLERLPDLRLELGTALGVHAFVMVLLSGRPKERRK
jgi:hypothetical protein